MRGRWAEGERAPRIDGDRPAQRRGDCQGESQRTGPGDFPNTRRPSLAAAHQDRLGSRQRASGTPVATPLAPGYLLDGTFASAALGVGDALRHLPAARLRRWHRALSGPVHAARHRRALQPTGRLRAADSAERLIATGQIGALIIVFPQGDQSYFVNHTGTDDERWATTSRSTSSPTSTPPIGPSRRARRGRFGRPVDGWVRRAHARARPPRHLRRAAGAHSPSLRTFEEAPAALAATSADYALIAPRSAGAAARSGIDAEGLDRRREPGCAEFDRTTQLKDILRGRGLHPEYRENDGGHDGGYWSRNAESYLRFYDGALTPAHLP